MKWLIDLLLDSSTVDIDVDGVDRLAIHGRVLARKPMLRQVFTEFHHVFRRLDEEHLSGQGSRVELGAGIAPIRESYPDVLATDLVAGDHLDCELNAENMDMPDHSVRTIYGQNCFHHFPHPDRFFSELDRVLEPGGGVILLEPYHGFFASFLYKHLFKTEGFDKKIGSWETPASGPMNGANQALSYIIFERDKVEFESKYPALNIVHQERLDNYLKYLFSGGLNFKQLCPDVMMPFIDFVQWCLSPFSRLFALHHIIVIRKETL